MKRSTKLFALLLCALLLLPGLFACKPQTDDPSDTDGTTEQPSAEQTTELPTEAETEPPIDPAMQNQSLITEQAFLDPAREYRALKIEHSFANLPGASWEEKAQSLIDYGFGGAACNMKWDENYLQPGQSLNDFAAFVDAAHKQNVRIWLYDEYGYPSGAAGNLTVKGGSLVLTTLVLEVPFLANAFGFTPIGLTEYAIALALGFVVIPIVEIVKFFQRKLGK